MSEQVQADIYEGEGGGRDHEEPVEARERGIDGTSVARGHGHRMPKQSKEDGAELDQRGERE